jgi:type II secretory pathway pseudopilin PulG
VGRAGARTVGGHTLAETAVALAVGGLVAALALPSLGGLRERAEVHGAARELASQLRRARSRAVAEGRSLALVFDHDARGWRVQLYADGDGDGVRADDRANGVDPPIGAPMRLKDRWDGVDLGFPALPRIHKLPPASGWLASLDDPVQFGSTDVISFSPQGDASSGSLFVSDGRSVAEAIVLFGPTARVRVFRYDAAGEDWQK